MGEVISYTKEALEDVFIQAEVVGTDLILTRLDGGTVTISFGSGDSITQEDLDNAIAALVGTAPELLDTFGEISAALANDNNFATTLTNLIANNKAGSMGVVIHGATAGTARPTGYGAIHWIGSVTPTNAIDNDVWTDTSA